MASQPRGESVGHYVAGSTTDLVKVPVAHDCNQQGGLSLKYVKLYAD